MARCGPYYIQAWVHAVNHAYKIDEFASPDYPCFQCSEFLPCTLEGRHDPADSASGHPGR